MGADLLAEITLHLTADDKRKAIISKLEDAPGFALRQKVIQALVFTAIDLAKEREIGINFVGLNFQWPYRGPTPCSACQQPIPANAPAVLTVNPPRFVHPGCQQGAAPVTEGI